MVSSRRAIGAACAAAAHALSATGLYLHGVVAGGLIGRFILKTKVWRWAVYLLIFNGGMFLVQWELIDDGAHLELPGAVSSNPVAAGLCLDQAEHSDRMPTLRSIPTTFAAPREDFHSFRALAERSQLSDADKDAAVVTQVPSLGPAWQEQQAAQAGWPHFELADFERLKTQFGVDWVLVSYPQPAGLACHWHNDA